ncbi:MAG TPA: hypothetical protein VFW19_05215 [Allosphingosinicella sp.]|nr:hypothetical protein [Allosphingosinicella sp.]
MQPPPTPAPQPSQPPMTPPPTQPDTTATQPTQPEPPPPSAPSTTDVSQATDADLKAGAKVSDMSGTAVGTVASADDQNVTLALNGSTRVRVPRSAVGKNSRGLVVSATKKQLQAAAHQPQPAQPH